MSELMTDVEVREYAQNVVNFIGEDGSVSQEGLDYLANNVPSSEDQQRIIAAIKDIKANEDQPRNDSADQGDTQDEVPSEVADEVPVEAENPA